MPDYDPINDPLAMPIGTAAILCHAEHPISLPLAPGKLPGNTLRGLLRRALWDTACYHADRVPCQRAQDRHVDRVCREPLNCLARWINQPPSLNGNPVPLLWGRVAEFEDPAPVKQFTWQFTLRGRRLCNGMARQRLIEALRHAGQLGLHVAGKTRHFELGTITYQPERSLWERAMATSFLPTVLKVEFETPLIHANPPQDPLALLAAITGTRAYYLVMADLLERGLPVTREEAENYASQARQHAEQSIFDLRLARADLAPVRLWSESVSNGQRYPLSGVMGQIEVSGRLETAYPWLLNLALDRAGQHGNMGFGVTRLWWAPPGLS